MSLTLPRLSAALLLPVLVTACATDSDEGTVPIVEDNALADGFDFPVQGGEMDGWATPPEVDEAWDASSYLVDREDGLHAAIDFMREDGGSSEGYEIWAVADGVVVDLVYDRAAYPDLDDGEGNDQGWGNLMLIQHDYEEDGVIHQVWSMYAHCETIEVDVGDRVTHNQRIGLIGNTDGGAGLGWSHHLHFETRTTNLAAHAWPQEMGLNTAEEVSEHYTHPLEFIQAHRPD
jgi:murein DD-endopeptidase MepM/ murein hydrolase activator NlpD